MHKQTRFGGDREEEGDVEEEDDENEERDQRDVTEVEDELEQSLDPVELQLRRNQLQDDVEILAAHLETQMQEREKERTAMSILQNQLQQANMEMARNLPSLRIENDALRRQNGVLQQQRDEFEQKALLATETHDELLLALNKQQQIEEQLQTNNAHLTRERAQARKSLETAQNHCRRLGEELAATQTQLIRLQDERKALQVALAATHANKNDEEAEKIRLQEEMIDSLRSDLLQMEFEFKTLTVEREALAEKLSKLLRKNTASGDVMDSGAYEVIPLGNATTANTKPLIRNNYESEDGGFSGVMELPNFVGDRQESFVSASLPGSTTSSGSSSASLTRSDTNVGSGRRRSSVTALVSKTVSSAKKKFFVLGPNKLVLPQ